MLDFETFNVLVGTHVSALLAEHGAVPLEVVEVKKLSDKTGSMSAATTVDRISARNTGIDSRDAGWIGCDSAVLRGCAHCC